MDRQIIKRSRPGEFAILHTSTSPIDGIPPVPKPIALIPLKPAGYAIIDAEDYELVTKYKWRLIIYKSGHIYAHTTYWKDGKSCTTTMHRLICDSPKGKQVNHWSDNGLDNRRENLVPCTYAQNQQYARIRKNTKSSKYKGVSRYGNNWRATIRVDKQKKWLGEYRTEIEAAIAYDRAAVKHFGEFARPNFPNGDITNQ